MEKMISIKVLNELLKEETRHKYYQTKENGHMGVPQNGDGYQGEYNETFKFYKHPELPDGVFLKVTYQTDSYADNESITEMEFVEGKEKTIVVFEKI